MTDKEAREIILTEWKCVDRQDTPKCDRDCRHCDLVMDAEMVREAYRMAIKALEQQPCVDCISREEAINEMSNALRRVFVEHRDIAEKTINKLPSVTPKQKVGKWIRSWCEWQQYLECSKCGYETGLRYDTNYCPNCGAKMEVEDETI